MDLPLIVVIDATKLSCWLGHFP